MDEVTRVRARLGESWVTCLTAAGTATALGISRASVKRYAHTYPDFPRPVGAIATTVLRREDEVLAWARRRPPQSEALRRWHAARRESA